MRRLNSSMRRLKSSGLKLPGIMFDVGMLGMIGMRISWRLPSGPTKNIMFPLSSPSMSSVAIAMSARFMPCMSTSPSESPSCSSLDTSNATGSTSMFFVSAPRRTPSLILVPGSASRSALRSLSDDASVLPLIDTITSNVSMPALRAGSPSIALVTSVDFDGSMPR